MSWTETRSPHFSARHEERDDDDAVAVLELLEGTRERLADVFPRLPDDVALVLHVASAQLTLAQPLLPLVRLLTAPAGRRYLAGWFGVGEVHVLAPRLLAGRASKVPGSRETVMLAPAALYVHLVLAANNERLPPPFGATGFVRYLRWAWLAAGAAQYFSGQISYARPAIARRLREGGSPSFPPSVADAALLGGSLFDLLAEEEGERAAAELAVSTPAGGAGRVLRRAFAGRPLAETEARWRAHLGHLAGP